MARLHKAAGYDGDGVVYITATMTALSKDEREHIFEQDAQELRDILYNVIPSGTLAALLKLLAPEVAKRAANGMPSKEVGDGCDG